MIIINTILVLSGLCGCFARSNRPPHWPTNNNSHIDQPTSETDPRLFSELRPRNARLVDTAAIPSTGCFENDCNNPQPPSLLNGLSGALIPQCHLVPVPCRPDEEGSTECYSWDLDCFCNAPEPLWCAWDCDWGRWFKVEDWFTTACPATSPVDFRPLPACARDCISRGSFSYGCITSGRSCFCLNEDLFDCPAACPDPADVQLITDWYQQTCEYSSASTARIVSAGKSTQAASKGQRQGAGIQTAQRTKLHWYEILIVITAVCTVAAAVVCTVVLCVLKRAPRFQKLLELTDDPFTRETGGLGVAEVSEVGDWTQPRA